MGTTPILGRRFGTLTVSARHDYVGSNARLLCRCDCGKEHVAYYSNLLTGRSRSCGCRLGESIAKAMTIHGCARPRSAEYGIWKGIKERCLNPRNDAFPKYGGRSIAVCERWARNFSDFLADMEVRRHRHN